MAKSWKGLKAKKGCPSCSPSVQLPRIKQGNNLEEKMAKSCKGATIPPTQAPGLPSSVGFCLHNSGSVTPTTDTLPSPVLRHLFQHGRCVPSCATNATSLERIGTTIFMPSKGCERPKTRRGS
ncbi:hypothetical protein M9H77_22704 [Catharanthus roseus]|uniref:Uncharacterized protein n=1 Tax=Catharanthus roseus TaxID=4058 RepID=A0ACC0ARX5_CATRO|nr:hypothetical protein M9H77_22704 [Catharanthus roseus]